MIRPLSQLRRVLLLLASLSLFAAACSSDESSSDEPSSESSGELSGTITVWHNYNEAVPGLFEAMNTWVSNFETAHPDVTVNAEYADFDTIGQKLIAANTAGETPDVMVIAPANLPDLQQAGVLADLTDLWAGYADRSQYSPELNAALQLDGKQVALQVYGNITGIYTNTSLLEELGLEPPTDVASFEAALEAAVAAGKEGFTGVAAAGGAGEFSGAGLFASQGWSYQDAGNAGLKSSLTQQVEWIENGWRSTNDSTGFVATDNFLTGDYLFAQDGNWQLANYADNATFEWTVGTVPGVYDTALLGGEAIAMGADSENPDAAWAFIEESFLSAEGQIIAAQAGSIPMRADVASTEVVTGDPALVGFSEIASNAIALPIGTNSGKVTTLIGDTYSAVIAGTETPEEAASKIAAELPDLLAG